MSLTWCIYSILLFISCSIFNLFSFVDNSTIVRLETKDSGPTVANEGRPEDCNGEGCVRELNMPAYIVAANYTRSS